MKKVLPSLTAAFVAAMVLFAANSANAAPKEITKVNVDSKGVILKGYDAVAYFTQKKPIKGNPAIRAPTRAPHIYLPRQRIRPLLTKIPQSMSRSMADFAPMGYLSENCSTSKVRAGLFTRTNSTCVEMMLRGKFSGAK
jgi:hypothetical protein